MLQYDDNYSKLNQINKQEQNTLLANRLKNAKPIVKTNCPHSFNSNKKKPNKSHERKDLSN